MRKVVYKGSTKDIGRFGVVKRGDILELTEDEWRDVTEDKRFKLVDPEPTKDELRLAGKLRPFGTNLFDLRTIPWWKDTLGKLLVARFSRQKLRLIIQAMETVGAVVTVHDTTNREWLADGILAAARTMGWDRLTIEEVGTLPLWEETDEGRVTKRTRVQHVST